ncbi:TPA: hypothetical protein QCU53_006042 [Bacillus thuringiensis]|nr:hypothetical protein [Bacillus thuringiensis]
MNSKEKIKADLEEHLNYIQGLKLEHSTKKIELASDGSGEVVAIELEKTVRNYSASSDKKACQIHVFHSKT